MDDLRPDPIDPAADVAIHRADALSAGITDRDLAHAVKRKQASRVWQGVSTCRPGPTMHIAKLPTDE